MPLCSICDSLDLHNLTDSDNDLQDITHYKSLADLQVLAGSCELCQLFFKELHGENTITSRNGRAVTDFRVILRGLQEVSEDYRQGGIYGLKVRCDSAFLAEAYFGLHAEDSAAISEDRIIGGAIRPAEERLDLVREWVQECNQHHLNCSVGTSKLPTRVIDVGKEGFREPFLKITDGESGHYMTLSHCWGTKPVIKTTNETLPQHQLQLPMSLLPKTFRDAVTITRSLNVQYLWIDSLCIIQDNENDWELESAVMGLIYSRSYLTIAAAASKDSDGGCFLERPTTAHIRVKYSSSDSETSFIFVREKPKDFKELEQSILQTRAWVAQERVLSPRTIHYDIDQILWECTSTNHSEDKTALAAQDYRSRPKPHFGAEYFWDWCRIVNDYTTRSLTHTDDKLPALSGIANIIESRTGDKYVAGLWESNLWIGMLWMKDFKGYPSAGDPEIDWMTRPPRYRAPSWSWASLDGRVVMPSDQYSPHTISPASKIAEEIQVVVQTQGSDPNGKVSSGFVMISAPLKTADPRTFHQSTVYALWVAQEPLRDKGIIIGSANYDEVYKPGGGPVYCLQMTVRAIHSRRVLSTALLLQPTGGENEFRRIGVGFLGGEDYFDNWFDDVGISRICIV